MNVCISGEFYYHWTVMWEVQFWNMENSWVVSSPNWIFFIMKIILAVLIGSFYNTKPFFINLKKKKKKVSINE